MSINYDGGVAFILADWVLNKLESEKRLTADEANGIKKEMRLAFGDESATVTEPNSEPVAEEYVNKTQLDSVALPPQNKLSNPKHNNVLTKEKKQIINQLRKRGFGYKRIANELCLNVNTVKSFCRRHPPEEQKNSRFSLAAWF